VHIVGVDPGLVHTGVVGMLFQPQLEELEIWHTVVDGPNATAVAAAIPTGRLPVYVEQYKPRQNLSSDQRMTRVEHELRAALQGAVFLPNMGIKRVITHELMDLLELWDYPTSTHHQDLRAAARIALLGMVKEAATNQIVADMVGDSLDYKPWSVSHG
jgi:hypothetical protein